MVGRSPQEWADFYLERAKMQAQRADRKPEEHPLYRFGDPRFPKHPPHPLAGDHRPWLALMEQEAAAREEEWRREQERLSAPHPLIAKR